MSDQEVFDYMKGYTEDKPPTAAEEARNAYYQGFITDWERSQLVTSNAIISHNNELVWLNSHIELQGIPRSQLLTKSRMEDIKADHLLGLGDGKTTTQITCNSE